MSNALVATTALTMGGGVCCLSNAVGGAGNPTIIDCTFSGNSASEGGGLLINNSPAPSVSGCTFLTNTANFGGGLLVRLSGGTVSGCQFQNNTASLSAGSSNESGGGLALKESTTTITDCTFTGNQAFRGAGMSIDGPPLPPGGQIMPASVTVTHCAFIDNVTAASGGGVNIQFAKPLIRDCVFDGNACTSDGANGSFGGGGMRIAQAVPVVVNCLFRMNTALTRGGGIFLDAPVSNSLTDCAVISNCTIVDNNVQTAGNGGGIQSRQIAANSAAPVRISNCIVRGNTGGPNIVFPTASHTGWITLRHSNVEGAISGPFGGWGNIDADPMFVDADNGDYRLQSSSPCIDSGHHWDLVIADITEDFDGNPRLADGDGDGVIWADMGAFEYEGKGGTLGEFPLPYAYWHFNDFTGTGPIASQIGNASIDVSTWGGTAAVGAGAFCNINAVSDTPAGNGLQLLQDSGGNGTPIILSLSMAGY